jgi:hypothetical protein
MTVPAGWTLDPFNVPHDASDAGIAATVYKYNKADPENYFDKSRVVQVSGSTEHSTDFDGKVSRIEYSADGAYLLVHQVGAPGLPDETHRVSLLNNEGELLWAKNVGRTFFFSTTGESVYAWYPSDFRGRGSEVEVFDLERTSIGTASVNASLRGATVIGAGDRAVLAVSDSILCLDLATAETTWRIDLQQGDPEVGRLRPIGQSEVLVEQFASAFKVLGTNGTVRYSYNPRHLNDSDPRKNRPYKPYEGPTSKSIVFYDGTADAFVVDVSSGSLERTRADINPPIGFDMKPSLLKQKLFFFSPKEIRGRSWRKAVAR